MKVPNHVFINNENVPVKIPSNKVDDMNKHSIYQSEDDLQHWLSFEAFGSQSVLESSLEHPIHKKLNDLNPTFNTNKKSDN